ncbi:MAG: radical SAM protein [Candidatus Niyogibacteria bacterium]|nr:radical SAM protein [Candidatus Niyogibacteria bacterium]
MLDLFRKTGFPRINSGASNKRKTKTSIAIIANMAEMMGYLYFALQTLTEDVLANTKRVNIPVEIIEELVALSKKSRRPIHVDMIFGLPGETLKSFLETIDKVLSLGIAVPGIYILKMLAGTAIAEQDRKRYGYKTKFRPLNGRYGEYEFIPGHLTRVIETEEIAWQNNSFSANDYAAIRNFGFISMLLVGLGAFADTIFYLLSRGVKFTKVFKIIQSNYFRYPRLNALLNEYRLYSEKELFDNQDELISRITNNNSLWDDLLNGRGIFFKLDHGFSGYCLFEDPQILDDIEEIIRQEGKSMLSDRDYVGLEAVLSRDRLHRVIPSKAASRLTRADIALEIVAKEEFDYERWRDANFSGYLEDYRLPVSVNKIYVLENCDLFGAVIDQYSELTGFVFYEKIIIWGPKNLRRTCRSEKI